MAEDKVAVETTVGILSLPEEVLHVIAEYLNPQDLLAASASCHYLRSVFNVNALWRKYTKGGFVSQGLSGTTSLVEPKFQNPPATCLEPLCEHRLHFLRQSRLLSNIRKENFVEYSTELCGVFSDTDEVGLPVISHRNTYGGKFFFALDYEDDVAKVIKVFDIEISPKLLLNVKLLENHTASRYCLSGMKVVQDKLVVRSGCWFDVYDIKLPESLELSYSIIGGELSYRDEAVIISKHLFVRNIHENVVNVWDIANGKKCADIIPKFNGPKIDILGHSQDEQLIVMSGIHEYDGLGEEPSDPYLFVYRIETQDFSPFNPILNKDDIESGKCYSLIDNDYVVLLNVRLPNCSVFVFDYRTSELVVEKSNLNLVTMRCAIDELDADAKLIDGYLVLPSLDSVLVMSLRTLQTIWEIPKNTARSLMYEPHLSSMIAIEVLHISSLSTGSIVVINNVSGIDVWDFNSRTKILDLPDKGSVHLNDICSKLIICDFDHMKVLSFW